MTQDSKLPRVWRIQFKKGSIVGKPWHTEDAETAALSKECSNDEVTEFISMSEHLELLAKERERGDAAALKMRDEAIGHLWEEINQWKPTLHFCRDWDFLLIENGDPEFDACQCGPFPLKHKRAARVEGGKEEKK